MRIRQLIIFVALLVVANSCFADIDNSGLLDKVLERYASKASTWATIIEDRASWLYWCLVTISMVWTFGFMALRRADFGEFFAEFIRFTIHTGFFWWLLIHGPAFATDIINSMRKLGGMATGLGPGLSPSGIVDIGFDIFNKVLSQSSLWSPVDSALGIIIALIILVVLALVGVNMLLLLISGWVLAYGGIFYLGFGGSRWTSDIAINYYKTIFGIAMQLMTMILLVGIGQSIVDEYYVNMSEGIKLGEMGVVLIVSIILLMLVNKLPPLISGVITGAGIGGMGIGQFGAGAAIGAAAAAGAAAAVGGAMMAAGATQAAGGASAVMSAISKAQENVAAGTDIMSSSSSGGGGGGGGSSTGSTPFATAAGFAGSGTSSVASASSFGSSAKDSNDTSVSGGSVNGGSDSSQAKGGIGSAMAKVGRIAADASANLARGSSDVAKQKASEIMDGAKERISQTIGGQIATAIQERGNDDGAFEENSLSETPTDTSSNGGNTQDDFESEIASFRDKD